MTDRFRLTGGARYTEDHKQADIRSTNLIVICRIPTGTRCQGGPAIPNSVEVPGFAFGPTGALIPAQPFGTSGNLLITSPVAVSPSRKFDKVTWRGAAEFDIGKRSLLYASVETGFKSGGFFSSIDAASYDPETITAYTIGSKNRFLDNRLQINVEGFYWKYKGQQFSHFRSNSLGGQEFATENIGSSTVKGVELDTQVRATPTTLLTANVQYLDARYDSFVYRNPVGSGRPYVGCAVSQTTTAFVVDCSGQRPPQSPEWTLALGAEQTIPLGRAGKLVAGGHTRYQSRSLTAQEFLPVEEQPAYWMSDLQLAYVTPGDRLTVTGFVNNVENTTVIGFSQIVPQSGNSLVAYTLRPPRTYGIRVGFNF